MNFFKKLFGKSGQIENQNTGSIDIEKIIRSDDVNAGIIALDDHIARLCLWGEKIENLNEHQRNFYLNQNLEREINNGGFNQYFSNSSGAFAAETLNSLKAIGAHATAGILETAMAQFPGHDIPKSQDKRQEIINQIENKADEKWEKLDEFFFAYQDNLNDLNLEYIKKNKNSFT